MRKLIVVLALVSFALVPAASQAQSEKLTGVWEGIEHQEGRDKPAALVLSPRGSGGVGGVFYFNGDSFGALEAGRMFGDSLTFHEGSLHFYARLQDLNQLAVRLIVRPGKVHDFVLAHTSSDTTRRRSPPAAGARSVARAHAAPDCLRAHLHPRRRPAHACSNHGTLLLVGGGQSMSINGRFPSWRAG
jgi:hypothetical protein